MKIFKAIKYFSKKNWLYVKYVCQKIIYNLNQHNPDYVLSNYGKIPAHLKTRAEMTDSISLDELERL